MFQTAARFTRLVCRPAFFRLSSLSLLSLALLTAGCGGKSSPPGKGGAALHMSSAPVHNAQVGSALKYQAVTSEPGAANWVVEQGPHGATIEQGGQLTWTPTDGQSGDQAFKISAEVGGHTVTQEFTVTAASTVVEATAHANPSNPNGSSLVVDAPLSPVQGAALQIPPGSMPPGNPVTVTISSMQHAPVPPAAAVAGVNPNDLHPVEIGPTGMAFSMPARLQLPIPAALKKMQSAVTIQTYDYDTGHWKKVKVLNVDPTANVVTAEIQHFSTYVVTPDIKAFDLKLSLGGEGAPCASSLVVRATLLPTFAEVPALAVNGYAGAPTGSVADVLSSMKVGEALQVYLRVHARSGAATGEQTGWALAAATKLGDKSFKVSVTSDSHAGAYLKLPATTFAATDAGLLAWMNGSRVDFVFGALGALDKGAIASAEASLYLVPAADADQPPPASANALATEELAVAPLAPLPGAAADDDCDGAPNAYDADPQGVPPPTLVGFPQSPVHVGVGAPAVFTISSPLEGVTFKWSADDAAVTLVSGMEGAVGTATFDKPGLFHVTVTGKHGEASSVFTWDVIADPAAVAAANTPPVVAIAASANVVRAGEAVRLTALGKDAEQATLTFGWLASDPTVISTQFGESAVFAATVPGDYVVSCIASDGAAQSAPAKVIITVLSATANRPPGVPNVSPISAALMHDGNAPVTLVLTAKAEDPDGDALTYEFTPDPATDPTFTLTKAGAAATFTTTQNGAYVFYVTATDPNGARSPWAIVKLLVLPTISASPTDADKDGYPAGFDCNDGDPNVRPGAKEICGDGKDQDCDGKDLAGDQCDGDGDRFTPAQGDCDDKNPAISPQMPERCDGIDNNCNQKVDEGFDVGVDCKNGMGACQVAAKTVCSASFGAVVCGGAPGVPKTETCDGVDNDCNGRVDDVPGMAGGDVQNCGGCGIACPALPNSASACVMGGCATACAAGFVDADRNPANGCECKLSNGGIEICDGVDNDCNGAVDEGVGMQTYTGPAGSMGVGVCSAGVQICQGGKLVDVRPAQLPGAEVCDGLDNDCNGKVDDGFDIMNDSKNCGGCGIVCAAGGTCQQGRCPGGGAAGVGGGADAGVPGGGMLSICKNAAGDTLCIDIGQDRANCGACGHACATGEYCSGGLCNAFPAINCQTGTTACTDTGTADGKQYCTDTKNDPRNCGTCGKVCNGACNNGTCTGGTATLPDGGAGGATGADSGTAGATGAGAATGSCPAVANNMCPGPQNSTYCADFIRDPNNCGSCGHACAAGQVCNDGICMTGGATGTCGSGFQYCNGTCTSFSDDVRNCGGCGIFCEGSCNNGQCQALGQSGFGSQCTRNGDCADAFCIDQSRFGWPGGFCSSLCDANLPCPTNQVCVASPNSGSLGFCRSYCTTDASCGRSGFICSAGACHPDCRTAPQVCQATGQTCDGATGRCYTQTQATCAAPSLSCPTSDGRTSYCTEPTKDPQNCGGCGRVCGAGVACNNGVCGGAVTCAAPLQTCSDGRGGQFCTDTSRDLGNCGGCGKACAANAICSNGTCQGGGGTYQGLAACANGGAPICTNLYSDPRNCGACGRTCAATEGCYGGTCGTAPPVDQCPDGKLCPDGTGKSYCSNPRYDRNNCGQCGRVCQANENCMDGQCVVGGAAGVDAGATMTCGGGGMQSCMDAAGKPFCTNVLYDPANCGGCGRNCGGMACNNGVCGGATGGADAGTAPTCAGMATCQPAAAPAYCSNLMYDTNNCGVCFNQCAAGFYCLAGTCAPQQQQQDAGTAIKCVAPEEACDTKYCADLATDRTNCGGCHIACTATEICNQGVCEPGPI